MSKKGVLRYAIIVAIVGLLLASIIVYSQSNDSLNVSNASETDAMVVLDSVASSNVSDEGLNSSAVVEQADDSSDDAVSFPTDSIVVPTVDDESSVLNSPSDESESEVVPSVVVPTPALFEGKVHPDVEFVLERDGVGSFMVVLKQQPVGRSTASAESLS